MVEEQGTGGSPRPARPKWLGPVGLVAAGILAGGILAGTLTAGAASDSSADSSSSNVAAVDESQAHHPGETLLTGTTAQKVRAAALKAVPGGTILRVETDAEGSPYEAHMRNADGDMVTVKVNSDFEVTEIEQGHGGMRGSDSNSGSGSSGSSSSSGSSA